MLDSVTSHDRSIVLILIDSTPLFLLTPPPSPSLSLSLVCSLSPSLSRIDYAKQIMTAYGQAFDGMLLRGKCKPLGTEKDSWRLYMYMHKFVHTDRQAHTNIYNVEVVAASGHSN